MTVGGLGVFPPQGINLGSGQLADGAVTAAKLATDAVETLKIKDKNVTIAKIADGTDGNLITWDASGVAAVVATGTATHVLTSNGAGAAPTFQAVAAGAAMDIQGTESDTLAQIASAGVWVDLTGQTVTWTPATAGKYAIFAEMTFDTTTAHNVHIGINVDTSVVRDAYITTNGTGDTQVSAATIQTLTAAEHTIKIQFKDDQTSTPNIYHRHLIIVGVDS